MARMRRLLLSMRGRRMWSHHLDAILPATLRTVPIWSRLPPRRGLPALPGSGLRKALLFILPVVCAWFKHYPLRNGVSRTGGGVSRMG